MKREIRFRAFVELGESNEIRAMIENVVVYNESHDGNVGCFFHDMKDQIKEQTGFMYDDETECFYKDDKKVWVGDEIHVTEEWAFFQGEAIQFTCVNDKNDNPIYEGDILRVSNFNVTGYANDNDIVEGMSPKEIYEDINCAVHFNEGCFWFESEDHGDMPLHAINAEDLEVIGNIYLTPELLEA